MSICKLGYFYYPNDIKDIKSISAFLSLENFFNKAPIEHTSHEKVFRGLLNINRIRVYVEENNQVIVIDTTENTISRIIVVLDEKGEIITNLSSTIGCFSRIRRNSGACIITNPMIDLNCVLFQYDIQLNTDVFYNVVINDEDEISEVSLYFKIACKNTPYYFFVSSSLYDEDTCTVARSYFDNILDDIGVTKNHNPKIFKTIQTLTENSSNRIKESFYTELHEIMLSCLNRYVPPCYIDKMKQHLINRQTIVKIGDALERDLGINIPINQVKEYCIRYIIDTCEQLYVESQ